MINPILFVKETRLELQKVSWPKRDETVRLTGLVIFTSLLCGLYLGGLDALFLSIFSQIIK